MRENRKSRITSARLPSVHDIFWAAKSGDIELIEKCYKSSNISEIQANDRFDRRGFAPLHYAAQQNETDMIHYLLKNKADVNIRGYDDLTPLHVAAKYNSLSAVRVLLDNGAEADARDIDDSIPLHEAVKMGNLKVCKEFLNRQPSLINVTNKDLQTPLHIACLRGKIGVCQLLVNKIVSTSSELLKTAIDGCMPIHYAAEQGNVQIIETLLDAGSAQGINFDKQLQSTDKEGRTVLYRAVQGGKKSSVLACLEHVQDISAVKMDGMTVLHEAASGGFADITDILLKHGVSINAQDELGKTALHAACGYGHIKVIKALLDGGADMRLADSRRRTPLLFAIENGQLDVIKFLLKQIPKVDCVDVQDKNGLHIAASHGYIRVLTYLIMKGARSHVNNKDVFGRTPIHYAADEGYTQIVDILFSNGGDLNYSDIDTNTPLHLACKKGEFSCVKLICDKSLAQLNMYGERSRTPLHLATINNHANIVEYLLQRGADINKRDGSYFTSLDIAIDRGYIEVAEVLLSNRANVNLTNSNQDTPLHIAARKGDIKTLELLLHKGGEIFALNKDNMTCLDLAIDNANKDVALLLVNQKGARSILMRTDSKGWTVMQRLVQKLPEVAKAIMDQCVEYSGRDRIAYEYKMKCDFTFIDPGPDFEENHTIEIRNKMVIPNHNALQTMKRFKRGELLNHQLSKVLLDSKWRSFGSYFYYANLAIYMIFLALLSYFVVDVRSSSYNSTLVRAFYPKVAPTTDPPVHVTEWSNPITTINTTWPSIFTTEVTEDTIDEDDIIKKKPINYAIQILVIIFVSVNLSKEAYQVFHKGLRYFRSGTNYIELCMYGFSLFLMIRPGRSPDAMQWICGSLAIWLAWVNILLFFERISSLGIYVIMLKTVLYTFLKVMFIVIIFIVAFAFVFIILAENEDVYGSFSLSCIKVLNMMVGEIDYNDIFVPAITNKTIPYPYNYMTMITLIVFMFLMPILLTNLMIGLAIGDIDQIQKSANLRRLANQVDFLDDLERSIPAYLRKKFHKSMAIRYINSLPYKLYSLIYGDVTDNNESSLEPNDEQFRKVFTELDSHQHQMKNLSLQVDKVLKLLSDRKCDKEHDSLLESLQTPI
ncbi:Transient receptor potential cation channel subfamily A member 1 [Trichoplax sp. H2]|nr:Transient receptor potential cation channel subfamily A member 1 [Trichoplax sp. H2]|eukprot:RDD38700.1 Transient receptor potential cation channel subfamily A member 1 [Trichoplax sp. H2]